MENDIKFKRICPQCKKEIFHTNKYFCLYSINKLCMSCSRKGNKNGMYGRYHSSETKKKIKEKRKNQVFSKETREKLSKLRKGKSNFWLKGKCFLSEEGRKSISHYMSCRIISEKTKQKISNSLMGHVVSKESIKKHLETKERNGTLILPTTYGYCKGGWRNVGNQKIYARSSWEANYARILQYKKEIKEIKNWEHETSKFWFDEPTDNIQCYIPDFKVVNNNDVIEYHEVKGYMNNSSKIKLEKMEKYYSEVKLLLIDKNLYKELNYRWRYIIKEWEFPK